MCDYSSTTFPSRPAREGEGLLAHRFPSGCTGFISAADRFECGSARSGLKTWFFPRWHDGPRAVCVPPGAQLIIEEIAAAWRLELGLNETERAILVEVSGEELTYRDGLRLADGRTLLLQRLPEGQQAVVLLFTDGELCSPSHPVSEKVYA